MFEEINNNITSNTNITPQKEVKRVAFKGNPNAVDTTPTADTYQQTQSVQQPTQQTVQSSPQQPPKNDSMLRSVAYTIPTWYALNKGTDLFNKGCGGEYEKSIVGRLGKFGDYLSGTKLVDNKVVKGMSSTWTSFKTKAQAYIDKSPMLSAMQKTPTAPECTMVTSFTESQNECDIKEAMNELTTFTEKSPKSLKECGATKDEINALKSKYGTNLFGKIKNEKAAVQEFQLRKLGGDKLADRILAKEQRIPQVIQWYENRIAGMNPTDPAYAKASQRLENLREMSENFRAKQLKQVKLDKLGLSGGIIDIIKSEPTAHARTIEAALDQASTVAPKLSQNANKLKAMTKPATKLGRFLPKMAKLGMRGLTFGGGLFNTLFVALPLASSIKNTVDAPKEQKAGTLAEGFVDALSWVVSMPLALLGMHGVNGLKNQGLSKDAYQLFKDEQKIFNQRAKNGGFASLAEWTAEKTRIEGLKTVTAPATKFGRIMKKLGEVMSVGLEQFHPYKEATEGLTGAAKRTARMGNIKRMLPNFARNLAGYPLRFGLYMFVFAPIVDKVLSLATHAIFGKPYDPEKIKEEQAKESARLAALYPGPRLVGDPNAAKGLEKLDINTLSNNNMIKQKVLGVKPDAPQQPNTMPNGGFNAAPQTMVKGEPFMPPTFPQQQGGNTPNQPAQPDVNDPNKNTTDTIPRSFVPKVDVNGPLPYQNPLQDPTQPKNYQIADAMLDKIDRTTKDLDNFIANGYRD